jgi:hypothetical protein
MLKKLNHIFIGWGKRLGWLPTSLAENKMAELRLEKCKNCQESKTHKALLIINGSAHYEQQIFCKICSCPCFQKAIVVLENCPLKKW